MHLVNTAEVTAAGLRWAPPSQTAAVPDNARAIAIGLERTTVIVIENREGARTAVGEVIRTRHVGMVRLIAGDGVVLARRRLASTPGASDALVAHLLDEVRVAVTAAPHLVVGLVQDAGDATWTSLAHGLEQLRSEGAIRGWCEAIDRGALRERLLRTLCVIEPTAMAREERLDHWDACFDAWDDAIDGVTRFLLANRNFASHPQTVDAQLRYLNEHKERMRYASLRRAGLPLRAEEPPIDMRPRIPR